VAEIRRNVVGGQPGQIVTETLSQKHSKRTGRVIQVLERLPSKCEARSSNPSTAKKKKTPPAPSKDLKEEPLLPRLEGMSFLAAFSLLPREAAAATVAKTQERGLSHGSH
jgi:hypothetical protein